MRSDNGFGGNVLEGNSLIEKRKKKLMHTKITYKGFENDEVLDSMLLYICKCVAVVEAHEVFGKLQSRDIMS